MSTLVGFRISHADRTDLPTVGHLNLVA